MTHPIFYIKDVTTYTPQNAAQKVIIMYIEKCKWLTIDDEKDLERFETYLNDEIDIAQRCCPRSKKLLLKKDIMIDGTRRYEILTDAKNAHTVLVVFVTYIRGPWRKEVSNG